MALVKIEYFDRNFVDEVAESNIINFSVYAGRDREKVGVVEDILVDENEGKLRYLIVDIGFWIFGKKVLLPIGLTSISFSDKRVYAKGLTKEQAENLPEFNHDLKLDRNYEEQVRNTYHPGASDTLVKPVAPVTPVDPIELHTAATLNEPSETVVQNSVAEQASNVISDRDYYNYQNEPDLYELNDTDHQLLKLYQERLIARKKLH